MLFFRSRYDFWFPRYRRLKWIVITDRSSAISVLVARSDRSLTRTHAVAYTTRDARVTGQCRRWVSVFLLLLFTVLLLPRGNWVTLPLSNPCVLIAILRGLISREPNEVSISDKLRLQEHSSFYLLRYLFKEFYKFLLLPFMLHICIMVVCDERDPHLG